MSTKKEMEVEERLKTLYKLQEKLSEIDTIKTLRGELPLEVADLEDEIVGLKTRIEKLNSHKEETKQEITAQKQKMTDCKAKTEKYKEQLDNVRNNREFDHLSKELEYESLEAELAEKKIREFTADLQNLMEEITNNTNLLTGKEADLEHKKNELEDIVAETKHQEETLRQSVKDIETRIDERLLTAFRRIRKSSRNGLAIVCVERGACGGCYNRIPAQRQLDVKMGKKIIVCEYCGRIMVDPELVHAEIDE